mmetsp:Transcript_5669/g.9395  ORF Transcript_5669/g.9395 Transcript_5669/m.9395 type:complete len:219 (+) Transcript_5669:2490-3146(+)
MGAVLSRMREGDLSERRNEMLFNIEFFSSPSFVSPSSAFLSSRFLPKDSLLPGLLLLAAEIEASLEAFLTFLDPIDVSLNDWDTANRLNKLLPLLFSSSFSGFLLFRSSPSLLGVGSFSSSTKELLRIDQLSSSSRASLLLLLLDFLKILGFSGALVFLGAISIDTSSIREISSILSSSSVWFRGRGSVNLTFLPSSFSPSRLLVSPPLYFRVHRFLS